MDHQQHGYDFTSAVSLDQQGVSSIPQRYVLPPSQRPTPPVPIAAGATLPIIDLSNLKDHSLRSQTINQIRIACKDFGFFQVINHGIDESVMNEAHEVAAEFFNLPNDEKMQLFSDDVHKPVRYGTSLNQAKDEVYCWRDFIKHYSHPISDWIHMWHEEMNEGSHVMAVNCYPACPEPGLTLGIHPHSDYGSITLLLQTRSGLQIKDSNNNWVPVPFVEGALVVQLGDQMEVLSNGEYKSVIHRATVNDDMTRFSIVSLHSFAMDKKMGPAVELVDDQHPKSYKEFSFRDFLDFITSNDVAKGRYIDTLKMKP